jgi:4-amino-4-deoxy-L-arabinose transferase-like glycosyltransferase
MTWPCEDYTTGRWTLASDAKMTKLYGLKGKTEFSLPYPISVVNRPILWLIGAALTAFILKTLLIAADVVPFNSDEAIVALMASHILHGARPTFFYGQAYMGSLDTFLVAGGFSLLGERVWVIRLVQAMLYLGTLLTTAWIGKKAFGSRRAGILAAWFLAIPTINVTLYTTVSLGGYGEMLLLGNLILLVGLYLGAYLDTGALKRVFWFSLLFGILTGLGIWAFGLTLVYSLPVGVYLGMMLLRLIRNGQYGRLEGWKVLAGVFAAALVGLIIGAIPWWLYAVNHGLAQLMGELRGAAIAGVEGLSWPGQILQHLFNLILLGGTVIFGLRPPWEVRWLVLPLIPFVLFFWMAILVYSVRKIRAMKGLVPAAFLLGGVVVTLVLGFLLTPFGADPSGRYFLPLAVPLALAAAKMVLDLREGWGKRAWSLVGLVLVFNLGGTIQPALDYPARLSTQFDPVAQIDHTYDQELITFLEQEGEYRGYSNYWVAYPLAFKSDEALVFIPRLPYHHDFRYTERDDRYEPYDRMVGASEGAAYITTNHLSLDDYLRTCFAERGIAWKEHQIGDYHIFYNLSRPVRPMEIGLGVTTP